MPQLLPSPSVSTADTNALSSIAGFHR